MGCQLFLAQDLQKNRVFQTGLSADCFQKLKANPLSTKHEWHLSSENNNDSAQTIMIIRKRKETCSL